ncbi:MAG: hypothetical protein M1834_006701 [Cirrosporium novae-zelandiae]|nr:MAG: hypothetical protein M1834_006701 [Cirrosporium novae-zelandiae]
MDALNAEYGRYIDYANYTPGKGNIEYLDIQTFSGDIDPIIGQGLLDDDMQLETWLHTKPDEASKPEFLSHLKLLAIPYLHGNPPELSINKESFRRALKLFKLPPSLSYVLYVGRCNFAKFVNHDEANGDMISSFYLALTYIFGTLEWSHNPRTSTTMAIFFYKRQGQIPLGFTHHLLDSLDLIHHPLHIVLAAAIQTSAWIDRERLYLSQRLARTENRTGSRREYNPIPLPQLSRQIDLGTLSASLTDYSARLALCETCIQFLKLTTQFMLSTSVSDQADLPEMRKTRFHTGSERITECCKFLENVTETQMLHVTYLQERAKIQLSALFHLIAQRDQNQSIQLARDSRTLAEATKRDSQAMKTIAIVTMVFLPGTFMASLFAMPFFNWDARPGKAVLGDRFWIYWAVTVPLTLVTILSWVVWSIWKERMEAKKDKKAEEEEEEEATQPPQEQNIPNSNAVSNISWIKRRLSPGHYSW